MMKRKCFMPLIVAMFLAFMSLGTHAQQSEPIRALYVTGGGWHDFATQETIITEGIGNRILIEWTVDFEAGTDAGALISRFQQEGWHEGFDLVVYNKSHSEVGNVDYIESIVNTHVANKLPAVFLHASTMSFRNRSGNPVPTTFAWWDLIGADIYWHEDVRPLINENIVPNHPIMRNHPATWTTPAPDEMYVVENIRGSVDVLAQAYGTETQTHHPTMWTNVHQGVRSFTTTLGHNNAMMAHDVYLDTLARAILWVTGRWDAIDEIIVEEVFTSADMPDGVLREPMSIDFAYDGTLFLNERQGYISQLDPQTGHRIELLDMASQLDAFYMEPSGGLVGLALQPGFDYAANNLVYVAYTPELYHRQISTFEYKVDAAGIPYIDAASENVIYTWDILHSKNDDSRHVGGDIRFGPDGKLYVALGDEVSAGHSHGYTPIDQRPGAEFNNALLTSQNPLHPSGSILRLNPDGTAPDDNPFVDDPDVLDEIWALGFRNPFRIHIDPVTGWVLVGDNGPDANAPNPSRGPAGMTGWHLVSEAGQNHGWPMCSGANEPYMQYDFATGTTGEPFDCSEMTPALVWLLYAQAWQFPLLRSGAISPIGGVILRQPAEDAPYPWHNHYLNHWYPAEFSRGYIVQIKLEDEGTKVPEHSDWYAHDLNAPEDYGQVPPPPGLEVDVWLSGFIQPIDLRQSPDGALYLLTMGSGWRVPNADAGIYRIYNKTMIDPPIAVASAQPWSGQAPLEVTFSAAESLDIEGSGIQSYLWDFGDGHTAEGAEAMHTYAENGTYAATVRVVGSFGNVGVSQPITVVVGNTAPDPVIENPSVGATYDQRATVRLRGSASDAEDGVIPDHALRWEVVANYKVNNLPESKVVFEAEGNAAGFTMPDDAQFNWHRDVTYTARLTAIDSGGLANAAEQRIRYARLQAEVADASHDFSLQATDASEGEQHAITSTQGAYLLFEDVNLTGQAISFLEAKSARGALIELRSGSPDGDVLAVSPIAAGGEWSTVPLAIGEYDGVHDLYIVVALLHEGDVAINWLQLIGPGSD